MRKAYRFPHSFRVYGLRVDLIGQTSMDVMYTHSPPADEQTGHLLVAKAKLISALFRRSSAAESIIFAYRFCAISEAPLDSNATMDGAKASIKTHITISAYTFFIFSASRSLYYLWYTIFPPYVNKSLEKLFIGKQKKPASEVSDEGIGVDSINTRTATYTGGWTADDCAAPPAPGYRCRSHY